MSHGQFGFGGWSGPNNRTIQSSIEKCSALNSRTSRSAKVVLPAPVEPHTRWKVEGGVMPDLQAGRR